MKRSKAIRFYFIALCLLSGSGIAWAQGEESLPSGRMESTLLQLKHEAQSAVQANRTLADKIKRFKERISSLEKELQQTAASKEDLMETRQDLYDQLKKDIDETRSVNKAAESFDSNLSRMDDQELAVKSQLIKKNAGQEALQQKIDGLRREIADLKRKLQDSRIKPSKASPEHSQLNESLKQQAAALDRFRQEYQKKQADAERVRQQISSSTERSRSLSAQQSVLEQAIAELDVKQQGLQESLSQRQAEHDQNLAQINSEIDALKVKRDELNELAKISHSLKAKIASGPREEQLNKTIAQLSLENELLVKQYDLLANRKSAPPSSDIAAPVQNEYTDMENKVAQLNEEYETLKASLDSRQKEMAPTGNRLAILLNLIPRIKQSVQDLTQENQSALELAKERLMKDQSSFSKEFLMAQNKNFAMKEKISLVQQDLDQMVVEEKMLLEEAQQAQAAQSDFTEETLKGQLEKLRLNKEYLEGTLKVAKVKLNDMDDQSLPWSNEEEDLRNHIMNLREENKHLQVEVFSLNVKQDKGAGKGEQSL